MCEKPSSTSVGKSPSPNQAAWECDTGRHVPAQLISGTLLGSRTGSRQTLGPVYEIFPCRSYQSEEQGGPQLLGEEEAEVRGGCLLPMPRPMQKEA